jgi:deoxyribodipyrimidine photo-lyase
MSETTLVWFRKDLRLADHPALHAAIQRGTVIPVFIWSPDEEKPWAPGAASRWWLHHSLKALDAALRTHGARLTIREGPTLPVLRDLLKSTQASAVYWSRRYEPAVIARDTVIKDALKHDGITAESFNSHLLFEPWTLKTQAGKPFQVFTPFWNACLKQPEPPTPYPTPTRWTSPSSWPSSRTVDDLPLLPALPWAAGFMPAWTPGETGAMQALDDFLDGVIAHYPVDRNRPDHAGTSRLSPHLHFGEIGPRQIWHAAHRRAVQGRASGFFHGMDIYLKEIGWREFAHHLLFHFPETPAKPLRESFQKLPWRKDAKALARWQKGQTGYPIVDAGLRELWATGWMHNRVRMIAASFLVKDLLIPWQEGARWFWDTLVDADLANNTLGWQWTAGCGADAAPYYRVFNPTLQGEKFDPEGDYIRKWIPELGTSAYPSPMVDHAEARLRALGAFKTISK